MKPIVFYDITCIYITLIGTNVIFLKLTVALKIHETCGTYATVPLTTTLAFEIAGSSPSIAEISDVFPSPVLPTIATKLPTGISKLTSDNVGPSAW